MHMNAWSVWRRYGYFWATLTLFLGSLILHWWLAWHAFVDEQLAHGQPVELGKYAIETGRDMFENWQSEFLQLIWQVSGLALLFHVGSPQSKEEGERLEAKLDLVLKAVSKDANMDIERLDSQFARTG
jgi:hypothetical protein